MSKESLIQYIKHTWGTNAEILICEIAEENSNVGVAYFKTLLRHFVVVFKLSTEGWTAVSDLSPGFYPIEKGNVINIALDHRGKDLMMAVARRKDSLVLYIRIWDGGAKLEGCFSSPNKPDPSFGKSVRFDRNVTSLQIGEKVTISSDWGEYQYLYLVDNGGVFHNSLIAMRSINEPTNSKVPVRDEVVDTKEKLKDALQQRYDELRSSHQEIIAKIGQLHEQINSLGNEKLKTGQELILIGNLLQQYKET